LNFKSFVKAFFSIAILTIFSCKEGEKQKTVVTFWHAMGGPLGKTLDSLILEFNKEHFDIRIDPVSMGNYQALSQKLMAAVAAKKPPVISQVFESWTDQLIRAYALTPLEDLLTAEGRIELENDLYPVFVEDNTYSGKLVTLPFNKSVPAYFYNKTVFSEVGIEGFPESWDKFVEIGKKLTRDKNGDGIADTYATAFPMSTWMFETLLYQNGGRLLSDKNRKSVFNKIEGIDALKFQLSILNKYKIGYLTTGYQHQDDFIAGKVAAISGSIVSHSFIISSKPEFEIGIAAVPKGQKNAVLISGTNIALFDGALDKQKKAAVEFINWFLSPEIQAQWSYGTGYVPVRISSLQRPLMKKRMQELPGLESVFAQLNYAYTEPRIAAWLAGRQILGTEGIEPVLRGVKTPKEALDYCAKKIDRILKDE